MDALTLGTPILYRRLTFSEQRKMPVLEVHLDKVNIPHLLFQHYEDIYFVRYLFTRTIAIFFSTVHQAME